MKTMIRVLLASLIILEVSACSLMPWVNKDSFRVELSVDHEANSGTPITMIIEQPADQKSFVTETYTSLSQHALDKGVQRYVISPKLGTRLLSINVEDSPLAVYFIFKRQPISGWKYYIKKPKGDSLILSINKSSAKKVN
ncbi:type VI secretion system lipoprotein IglE [Dongshaea marina]|uniref:type VI secretion system lipoprotein IglE n=1 Tax=Dongshaea marina TaxID=2047966 RepID=UPI000D3ECC1C|nr:type VI secretion system lipoprotein IglE [Dongshaea marina]